jgi:hypothetical protein
MGAIQCGAFDMRIWPILMVATLISACSRFPPALYLATATHEVMVAMELSGDDEAVSHTIFAEPQHNRSGDYTRLDITKAYNCKSQSVLMKSVSGFAADGKLISTVSTPSEWKPAQGATKTELRIVCDRSFARTRKLSGDLAAVEADYRKTLPQT